MTARVWPGKPSPLGSTFDGLGVNFAVYSESARRVEVCLFDENGNETGRYPLPERTAFVHHGYIPGVRAGQRYGLRVHGDYDPPRGLYHNAHKLLVDPYAKATSNEIDWRAPVHPYAGDAGGIAMDTQDDAWGKPKSVVIDAVFRWGQDHAPKIPWRDLVIYEAHVKGLTAKHPDVPEELRGTYAGAASEPVLRHLQRIGVNAVELLPVHEIGDEKMLIDRGMKNYWGYNTLAYFAPAGRYARARRNGEHVAEFKSMVKAFHAAGIEVILDVVYNHTAEGNHQGPMLSLRGIDNATYYRLAKDKRYYMDYTGCGNSLNTRHPQTLKLVLDSLRYWVEEMHVDGFRFDLATTLARGASGFDRHSSFLDACHQDPVISSVRLIAEPWDVGDGGYQVGHFPVAWSEWNGRYRDAVRRFWKGDPSQAGEIGYRLTGSSDLYEANGRRPSASVNFITAHDGFTLNDLVSYDGKHNEANGENNKDGSDSNDSWNHGAEGDTENPEIIALRERQKRNFLATLFISQGVPMLLAGDEMGRTQHGNNNAYCQDNDLGWVDWQLDDRKRAQLDFVSLLAELRRGSPVLRREKFFSGGHVRGSGFRDIAWFRPDGREMTAQDWQTPSLRAIGVLLGGDAVGVLNEKGDPIVGDTLLVLTNAHHEPLSFVLPAIEWGERWQAVVDTRAPTPPDASLRTDASQTYPLESRSLAVLKLVTK